MQRVCPHCSTVATTTEARCPHCRTRYRRRSPLPAILVALLLATSASLGGTLLMLQSFGDSLDEELEEQVDIVQRDFDRDVRRLERKIEEELDRRLPAPTTP